MLETILILDSTGQIITSRGYRQFSISGTSSFFCLPAAFLRMIATRSPEKALEPVYVDDDSLNSYVTIACDGIHIVAHIDGFGKHHLLFVINLLETVCSMMRKYFALPLTESVIRSRFDVVYKLLDEIVYGGFPFCLELNNLESSAVTPSGQGLMDKLVSSVVSSGGASAASLGNSLTGVSPEMWWRRAGVSHSSNECYLDLVESINCILSPKGKLISGSISGSISVSSRLSGLPDLLVSFKNPTLFNEENISFHSCVRLPRWEKERKMSFTPPDGDFVLCDYTILDKSKAVLPFTVQARIEFDSDRGFLSLSVVPRQSILVPSQIGGEKSRFGQPKPQQNSNAAAKARVIENLRIRIKVPNVVASTTLFTQTGTTIFDPPTGVILWSIGAVKSDATSGIKLEGTLQYKGNMSDALLAKEFKPSMSAQFTVNGWAASGMKIDALDISCVEYTPYKRCRYSTKAGSLDLRI